jgi:hypothetical protein
MKELGEFYGLPLCDGVPGHIEHRQIPWGIQWNAHGYHR